MRENMSTGTVGTRIGTSLAVAFADVDSDQEGQPLKLKPWDLAIIAEQ